MNFLGFVESENIFYRDYMRMIFPTDHQYEVEWT